MKGQRKTERGRSAAAVRGGEPSLKRLKKTRKAKGLVPQWGSKELKKRDIIVTRWGRLQGWREQWQSTVAATEMNQGRIQG